MFMNYGYGGDIVQLLILIADIYAIINIFKSNDENLRKAVWIVIVLVMPVLGFILWYFLGPRGPKKLF